MDDKATREMGRSDSARNTNFCVTGSPRISTLVCAGMDEGCLTLLFLAWISSSEIRFLSSLISLSVTFGALLSKTERFDRGSIKTIPVWPVWDVTIADIISSKKIDPIPILETLNPSCKDDNTFGVSIRATLIRLIVESSSPTRISAKPSLSKS